MPEATRVERLKLDLKDRNNSLKQHHATLLHVLSYIDDDVREIGLLLKLIEEEEHGKA